ncbi:MAG: hypothetical protein HYV63_26695 [Candidatus Schekmanbacteria bacterium]|nr:hypothetical protein [Candidatus Schekmanbacteria bacterium]
MATYIIDQMEESSNLFANTSDGSSLPRLKIVFPDTDKEWCFLSGGHIEMHQSCFRFSTMAHEIGHLLHWDAWDESDISPGKTLCSRDETVGGQNGWESCGSHSSRSIKYGGRAFSEGFASFIGARMEDYLWFGADGSAADWRHNGQLGLASWRIDGSGCSRDPANCDVTTAEWDPATCTGVGRCKIFAGSNDDLDADGEDENRCCSQHNCLDPSDPFETSCDTDKLGFRSSGNCYGVWHTAVDQTYSWNRESVVSAALVNLHDQYNENDAAAPFATYYPTNDAYSMTMGYIYNTLEASESQDDNFRGFMEQLYETTQYGSAITNALGNQCMIHRTSSPSTDYESH